MRGARTNSVRVLLVCLVLVAAACSDTTEHRDDVLDAIDRTERLAHRFVFTEEADGRTVEVQGLVEDDFRYQARVLIDGVAVYEQIVVDDAVAVRLLEPAELGRFLDPDVVGLVDLDTSLEGVTVIEALRARRWVVDRAGAPPAVVTADQLEELGDNAVVDARTTLAFTRLLFSPPRVVKYSADSISPTYLASEDPFPEPDDGSGVTRYDLATVPLPAVSQAVSGRGSNVLPGPPHFRKAAVFVDEDDRVVRVMDVLVLGGRRLEDLIKFSRGVLEETTSREVVNLFDQRLAEAGDGASTFLLDGLNEFRDLAGLDPIRPRTMVFEVIDLGGDISVSLPAGDLIEADLAVMKGLGRKPPIPDDAGDDAGDSGGGGDDANETDGSPDGDIDFGGDSEADAGATGEASDGDAPPQGDPGG